LDHWRVVALPLGILITAHGHDRTRTFESAIPIFHEVVGKREGSFRIIGDLREMTGYETEARMAWQDALYPHRERIEGIVLVGGGSALVRMGAAVIGAFTGIPVRFVSSWTDIAEAIRAG
jgi:hypothetical protein